MAEFAKKIKGEEGDIDWVVLNTKDLLPTEIQTMLDSLTQIRGSLDAFWLIQKAEMILTNAERIISAGVTALNLVKAIANSLIGVVTQAADLSFMQLMLEPERGGFHKLIDRFRYHLFDATDENRPTDDGNAALITVLMIVSFKDLKRAQESFENIRNIWGKFKTEGENLLKDIQKSVTGEETTDVEDSQGFWKHYYRKRIVGSRARINEDGWYKQSLLDLLPKSAIHYFQDLLDSWGEVADGASDSSDLIVRTQAMYDMIFEMMDNIIIAVDAYSKLFTDNQITILKLPVIQGKPINAGNTAYKFNADLFDLNKPPNVDYSGRKTAVEQLGEYVLTLPEQLKEGAKDIEQGGYNLGFSEAQQLELFGSVDVANPFNTSGTKQNYTNFLRQDYNVGALALVFKGPSTTLLEAQVNTFLGMFGIEI